MTLSSSNTGTVNTVSKPRHQYINTTWNIRSYDVWGNAKDGYDVNDVWNDGDVEIRLLVQTHNVGTPQEFQSAYPSDSQIRRAMGLRRFKLETEGDDMTIYVNRERDSYPIGEMMCISHKSLSPIKVD